MKWSPSKRLAVYAKTGNRCARCSRQFIAPPDYDGPVALSDDTYRDAKGARRVHLLEIDHIAPRKRGGGNEITNLQPLCTPCNVRKAARFPVLELLSAVAERWAI